MALVGVALVRWADAEWIGIIDSTPLEASRYDEYAPFHPYYSVKMDKAHIFHQGRCPLAMVYSPGNDADTTHLLPLVETVASMQPSLTAVLLDVGYDSFDAHARVWYHLHARPCIALREGAVVQEERTESRIRHWVNKLWKEGGDVHAPLNHQLRFLFKQGRVEQVGMFFAIRTSVTLNSQQSCAAAVSANECTATSRRQSPSILKESGTRVGNST